MLPRKDRAGHGIAPGPVGTTLGRADHATLPGLLLASSKSCRVPGTPNIPPPGMPAPAEIGDHYTALWRDCTGRHGGGPQGTRFRPRPTLGKPYRIPSDRLNVSMARHRARSWAIRDSDVLDRPGESAV